MAISKTLDVNGARITTSLDDPDMPLLYLLRDNLGLHGPRFGCGLAQCGACTVHIDGKAARSCVTLVSSISDNKENRHARRVGHSRKATSGAARIH